MIRVAFWFDAPVAYSGGLNYIANLLHALEMVNFNEVQPYIFFATDVPEEVIKRFERQATLVRTPILKRKTLSWLVHKLTYKIFGSMYWVNALLKRHRIDVLSHVWTPFLGYRSVKVISWIPDFQYLHLPEMFPGLDVEKVNRFNKKIALNSDAVVVSSEHAFRDLLSLLPKSKLPHVEVLRFVSQPYTVPDQNHASLEELQSKYSFRGKYFLLPNQFWAHKNHEVVIRALALAKEAGLSMTVLMTGNPKDYRLSGAQYIDGLRSLIKELRIEEEAIILGLIDYNELLALMRYCVGFINPSRFEGWSSSVEEAKSVGKPVLMSNIPVHVEQKPTYGEYFDCDDAQSLSELMKKLWEQDDKVDHGHRQLVANKDLHNRTREFGLQFMGLINKVAASKNRSHISIKV
jgi:glycosyltransferase involved in cell wall biosynthesis